MSDAAGAALDWGELMSDSISPPGDIFVRSLFLIVAPPVLASLVTGVAAHSDRRKLSLIGGQASATQLGTTVVALAIDLVAAHVLQPGAYVPEKVREKLQAEWSEMVEARLMPSGGALEHIPI